MNEAKERGAVGILGLSSPDSQLAGRKTFPWEDYGQAESGRPKTRRGMASSAVHIKWILDRAGA